jgi:hypothetical protein
MDATAIVDNVTRLDPVMATERLRLCVYGHPSMTAFCECHEFDCGLAAAEAYLQGRVQHLLQMMHWDRVFRSETSTWYRPLTCIDLGFANYFAQGEIERDYWGKLRQVPSMQFLRNIVHVRDFSFPAEMRVIARRRGSVHYISPPRSLLAIECIVPEPRAPDDMGWGPTPPPDSGAGESDVSASAPPDVLSAGPS